MQCLVYGKVSLHECFDRVARALAMCLLLLVSLTVSVEQLLLFEAKHEVMSDVIF